MAQMNKDPFSYLASSEIGSIDAMYQQYLKDPDSVEKSWKDFFKGFDFALKAYKDPVAVEGDALSDREFKVINLIMAYRQRGHLYTETNPVRKRRKYFPTLDIENFGLVEDDLETPFYAGNQIGIGTAKLKDIIAHLKATYCKSIGVEYLYMRHPEVVAWLEERMEKSQNGINFTPRQKKAFYKQLMQAVNFEQFIHKKFIGEKRFSLEGTEGLIPAIFAIGFKGVEMGAKEYTIGMSHRGRLNVLANILQKPLEHIFREFEGEEYEGRISLGDVKYHLGYGREAQIHHKYKTLVNLVPNPSHLEAVLPVLEGLTRSKINNKHDGDVDSVVPIAIHGDAAIAGQGVVYETVQMAQLPGYKTGGTVHIVINNQVGFTTDYLEGRSSTYCTDVAKVTRSPVFHVNGDDVEAIVYTALLATEFRQKFNSDVFIDILSYRKYGHNEGDEPRFTQPLLYKEIASHPNPKEIYGQKLIDEGICTAEELQQMNDEYNQMLEDKLAIARESKKLDIRQFMPLTWQNFRYPEEEDFFKAVKTAVSKDDLVEIGNRINLLPDNINLFSKAVKIVNDRKSMVENGVFDWGMTELLTYGTLIEQGFGVRLSGQDSVRGTFAHRHAELTVEGSEQRFKLLQNVGKKGGRFSVYNSPLNEYGVMGFEYGYALADPNTLTIWEAQFGDFSNVAQVIIDQFVSSGEEKWGNMNGLVLLLPHAYEGQGPEHSSARIERFLALAARNNMQIMNFTSPANLFHAFRRQMLRDFRVPMVIFTPKSLLRHPKAVAMYDDLTNGEFQEVLDCDNNEPESVTRVVFCTGKIYYDLLERKTDLDAKRVALIRIEQLHPFPAEAIKKIIKKYPNALLHLWVQEEPENMGAWYYIRENLRDVQLIPVARRKSGSPATGLKGLHKVGQKEIIDKVFRKCTCKLNNDYCALQCVEGASRKEILKQHYFLHDQSKFSI
ncbi:2-oxoglutarate dehydrogenase E1 component [Saccharicrinis sp. FJH2]|uniref:2-oxoglutarate dehydrogenase E1 component n=1 Tax=Saccharicrinis sp. FJH65 TaxID=3344659 RepID=UPI0035F2B66C